MPSRMSLFNKEMFLQVTRSIGWISAIYFGALFFSVPIQIMMNYSGEDTKYFIAVNSIFRFQFEFQIILFITIPVLLSIFLFRFLHVKQAADLMHSLPVKRERMYHFYTLAGFIHLVIPVLLIAVITVILHSIYDLNAYFQLGDIGTWTGTVILFNALFYMAGVFVAMFTGISAVQGVMTYILLLFPAGISLLVIYNLGLLLYGFPSDYFQTSNLEKFTPIVHLTSVEREVLSQTEIWIYAGLVGFFYLISLLIYKKRKSEAASEAIAFRSLKSVFKYGVAICTMMLGGMYFDAMQNQFGWMLFGYVLGGTIGYFTAQMVLQKTWRVVWDIKGFAVFSVSMSILILVIQFLIPYENRIPDVNEINSVYFNDMNYYYAEEFQQKPMKNKENIEAIRKLHEEIIQNKKVNTMDMQFSQFVVISYELENGRKMVRQYRIDRLEYENELKKIYETPEFISSTNPLFLMDEDKVQSIRISDGVKNNNLHITDDGEINEFLSILKKEVLNDRFEADYYLRGNRAMADIQMGEGTSYPIDLKYSYTEIKEWLKKKDLLQQAMVTAEDVEYIIVTDDPLSEEDFREYSEKDISEKIMANKNILKIADSSKIEAALENAGYGWNSKERYTAVFVYKKGDYKEIRTFNARYVPDFIKEHFGN